MTNNAPAPSLRNSPTQARSHARLETILDASRRHYTEAGRDRFNTAEVAKLAGCSIGTIYRYFTDRVVLMDAIHPDRDATTMKLKSIKVVFDMRNSSAEEKLATIENLLAE